jgi:hypothetical protein
MYKPFRRDYAKAAGDERPRWVESASSPVMWPGYPSLCYVIRQETDEISQVRPQGNTVTLTDVLENLRHYDSEPIGTNAPSIYVADPWDPSSEAMVKWSGEKRGVPLGRRPILYYLASVRSVLEFFGGEFDALVEEGETEGMCRKLVTHISARNDQRVSTQV